MKRMLRTIGAATALGAIAVAGQPAFAAASGQDAEGKATTKHQQMHGSGQSGMMGNMMGGMMGGGQSGMMGNMMGGMMGGGQSGMMGNMMGSATNPCAAEKDLSAEDVKKIIEGRLAWDGNKRLKVGEVKKKGDDAYTVDIVTIDDSLVERLEVDRKTGATRRTE